MIVVVRDHAARVREVAAQPGQVRDPGLTRVLNGDQGRRDHRPQHTAVIGGILVDTDSINVRQVPGLGNLPLIGNLFKETNTVKSTAELIFFITPRIKPLDALTVLAPGEEGAAPQQR